MSHNAWLVVEGERGSSERLIMENSRHRRIFANGDENEFEMKCKKNLGRLRGLALGAFERGDKPLRAQERRDEQWHCHDVVVTEVTTGDKSVSLALLLQT